MTIDKTYISNNNSYAGQVPEYIVIHNTDNYAAGADAKAHAKAQHDGNFSGMSAHVYTDDKSAYQALPFNRGAWHVGVNYGGKLFGTVNNHNSVGIEMCVQSGYNYEKAFQNTVEVCKQIMKELNIPADRVVSHYDVCAKNCPSAIRAKGDWERFKRLIGQSAAVVDELYRIRKTWEDAASQIGAYKNLANAKKDWKKGYVIYDWNGIAVYPESAKPKEKCDLTAKVSLQLPQVSKGCTGAAVVMLQALLGTDTAGKFKAEDVKALKTFQKNVNLDADGICGKDTWKAVAEHMKAYTFK